MLYHSSRSRWIDWLVVTLFVVGMTVTALYTHHKLHQQRLQQRVQYSSDFPNMVVDVMNSAAK